MALLSPLLEELVLHGKAKLKTTVVGQSGHSVIDASKDTLVIIVEFDYQHFTDVGNPSDSNEVLSRSVHQLQFRSTKSANHFIIREPLSLVPNPAFVTDFLQANGSYKKETFLIHTGNIEISIVAVPSTLGSVSAVGVSPPDLGSQQPPLGYGSGAAGVLSTVSYEDGSSLSEYVPLTRKSTPFTTAAPFKVSQFLVPIIGATSLFTTLSTEEIGNRMYPIVNITYVEILRSLATKLFSTS